MLRFVLMSFATMLVVSGILVPNTNPDPVVLAEEIASLKNTVSDLQGRLSSLIEDKQCGCDFIGAIAKCPDGWTAYRNSCYFFGVIPETWADAEVTCERLGGHLAVIDDADEDAFVGKFIVSSRKSTLDLSHGYTWLGGHDFLQEGKWLWITGIPFNFTNWRGPNPNDGAGHGEDCLDYSGGWNDHVCTEKCNFVCERRSFVVR